MVDSLCLGLDAAWTAHLFGASLCSLSETTEPVTCSDCFRNSHTVFAVFHWTYSRSTTWASLLDPPLPIQLPWGFCLLALDALPAQPWLRHGAFSHPHPLRSTILMPQNIPTFLPAPPGFLVLLFLHLTCGSLRVPHHLPMCPHSSGHSTNHYRQPSLFCGQQSPLLHFRGDVHLCSAHCYILRTNTSSYNTN